MFESPNLPREDLPPRVPSKADSLASLVATHNPPRNYDLQVAERTRALAREFEVTLISEINASGRTFEILGVDTAPNGSRPGGTIFLSGGVHGEEPAGVVAVLDFLEVHAPAFLDQFRFRAIPCVNPSGYQSGLRKGVNGVDLNRNFFDGSQQPEVQAVYSFLKSGPQEFAATFDFHEIDIFWADEGFSASDNPLGYYFYETTRVAEKRFGPKMIEQANVFGEPCIWKSIYGDKNEKGGVYYPEANPVFAKALGIELEHGAQGGNATYALGTSLETFLFCRHCDHTFTFETPIHWPLRKRAEVHLALLNSALVQLCR